uniref:CC chemokine CK7 n=1 Tax=Sparus aurata TaxID=8175 RepID=D5J737_SPAAU|nr:CC chemokine CK7 [Sparus aurata]
MKTLLTFALLALIGLLHQNSAAIVEPESINKSCCLMATRKPVPGKIIQNVERSHSSCPVPAIILTTTRGRQICLDGSWIWAERVLRAFETSPSDPLNVSPHTN